MKLTGKIKAIGKTKEFGSNGFTKREMVIELPGKYPQPILVEFVKDKCAILDQYKVGQEVKVGINLRGRKWENPQGEVKYFNSIQGWKIEATASKSVVDSPESFEPAKDLNDNQESDLPF